MVEKVVGACGHGGPRHGEARTSWGDALETAPGRAGVETHPSVPSQVRGRGIERVDLISFTPPVPSLALPGTRREFVVAKAALASRDLATVYRCEAGQAGTLDTNWFREA